MGPKYTELTGTGHRRPVPEGRWRDAELDVTSPTAVAALVERERPGAVIYTAYDKSSREITVDGAVAAARAAARAGARFVFVSTDLVFDGGRGNYTEDDAVRPIMPYGMLKFEAEGLVKVAYGEALIVRPALLVGEWGRFQRPAYECEALAAGQPLTLYPDEWRSPVGVDDVAHAIWDLVCTEAEGVVHLGGPERMTRVELGRRVCRMYGYDAALIREAPRPPERPRDVSLRSLRAAALIGWAPAPVGSHALAAAGA